MNQKSKPFEVFNQSIESLGTQHVEASLFNEHVRRLYNSVNGAVVC